METQPAEDATQVTPGTGSDDDTQVRLRPYDGTGDPATSETPTTTTEERTESGTDTNDSFLDDEDYLPQEHRGPGRLTVALVAALVLAVGVLGGVWVQKQLGTSSSAAAGARGQYAGGAGGQGFPGAAGGQGAPGGTASGAAGAPGGAASGAAGAPGGAASGAADGGTQAGSGSGAAGAGSGSGTSTTPAVIGTVTSAQAKSLVVTDLGGTKHTVTVSSSTTLTAPYGHGSLKTGDTVAVAGSAGSDGSVTATGLTVS